MKFPLAHGQFCLLLITVHHSIFGACSNVTSSTTSSTSTVVSSSSSWSYAPSLTYLTSSSSSSSFSSSWSSSSSSTSITSAASSSSSSVSTTTTFTSSSSATVNNTATITPAPEFQWGNQIIPNNTCSVEQDDGSFQYTPCHIFAGTMQLSYFPENSGNVTYPSTYYNAEFSVTMTSPSLYLMVNTITAENSCGPLGPTLTNQVFALDLTDIYTIQPYQDHYVTTRMGPPVPLTMSDITSNCFATYGHFSTDGAFVNTHPVFGNYNRCNPRILFPIQLKRVGYPYWMHCSDDNYEYGLFDPPGAVPPVVGLLPPPVTAAAPFSTTYEPPSAAQTPSPGQAQPTAPVAAPPNPSPPPADPPGPSPAPSGAAPAGSNPDPPNTPASVGGSPPGSDPDPPGVTPSAGAAPAGSNPDPPKSAPSVAGSPPDSDPNPPNGAQLVASSPTASVPGSVGDGKPSNVAAAAPQVIATVGGQVISAAPGASAIVINSQTLNSGEAPITIAGSNNVASVGPEGLIVQYPSGSATTFALPSPAPVRAAVPAPIATVGGQVISAAPGASSIVLNGQTITSGGDPVTLAGSNNVASVGSEGLVVQYAGGDASTFAIPAPAPTPAAVPAPIATVNGQVISAAPGASSIVFNGQTITSGGTPVTLAGSNNVASIGSEGLVIQYVGGDTSTFAIPPPVPTPAAAVPVPIATINGQVISAAPGASSVVINGQTLTSGGAPMTLSGSNKVAFIGSQGLVVQDAGGATSTFAIPPPVPTPAAAAIATVNGQVISAAPGASTIIFNGQTIASGGGPITLAGTNNVAFIGSDGLVIQYPSGAVSTFAIPSAVPAYAAAGGAFEMVEVVTSSSGSIVTLITKTIISSVSSASSSALPITTLSPILPSAGGASPSTSVSSTQSMGSIIASIAGAGAQPTQTTTSGSNVAVSSTLHWFSLYVSVAIGLIYVY